MPRKSNKRNASGMGTIRLRKDDIWEARYTVGRDPGTGKQVQKSIYGKTQAEVRKKLLSITKAIDDGIYAEPSKLSVAQWMDTWLSEYTCNLKDHTRVVYEYQIRVHIKPGIGALKLRNLKTENVQSLYNTLQKGTPEQPAISSTTIKNIHGILHHSLEQALRMNIILKNPCTGVMLPRIEEQEMHPLTQSEMIAFFDVIRGSVYEFLFKVDIFTGMRQSEIIGLTWDRVNFENNTIYIDRQLMRGKNYEGFYKYGSPKNDKPRLLSVAPSVMKLLKAQKQIQDGWRNIAGDCWHDSEFPDLVFTNQLGRHFAHNTLTRNFKQYANKIGVNCHFHDMRHTYAVNALRAGDDLKTLQENLGHATAEFTLQRYAHYTEDMRKESAIRMEAFINNIENL